MPSFRPRISILTALLLMTIVCMAIVVTHLWREVGALRAENKRLNEERGTLVISDPNLLHAIRIPDRFAGDDRTSFRIYVPKGQRYVEFAQANDIPKSGLPKRKLDPKRAKLVGNAQGQLFASLDEGEHVVTILTTHNGRTADISISASLTSPRITLDAAANTKKDVWPTVEPDAYSVFGDGVKSTTITAKANEPLVLTRYRIEEREANPKVITTLHWSEPEYLLDGFMLWLEPAPAAITQPTQTKVGDL
jgi:hypothetical protein